MIIFTNSYFQKNIKEISDNIDFDKLVKRYHRILISNIKDIKNYSSEQIPLQKTEWGYWSLFLKVLKVDIEYPVAAVRNNYNDIYNYDSIETFIDHLSDEGLINIDELENLIKCYKNKKVCKYSVDEDTYYIAFKK